MRRLLVSVLVMLGLLWGLDRAVGFGMERLFRTSASLEDGDVLRRAWDVRAPIVVCGSSRASHHYVVDSLAAILGVPAYNLGRDGSGGALYEYAVAGIMTRHYTPAVWIMDVEWSIVRGPEMTGRLACFLPYVDSEPVAREVVTRRSRYEALRLLSRTYRYNSLVLSLLSPKLGKHPRPRLGFLPLQGRHVPPAPGRGAGADRADDELAATDTLKVHYLQRAVELLRARGVTVLAIRSPHYIGSAADERYAASEARELAQVFSRMHVRFMDFSAARDPRYRDARLFRDPAHLNEDGAMVFTRALADSLAAGTAPVR